MQILIVEDNELMAEYLKDILKSEDYQIIHTDNGREAIQLIENSIYGLILLDFNLPDLTGLDILKTIRKTKNQSELPVIMLSSTTNNETIVALLEEGANDFISKPFIDKYLKQKINNLLQIQSLFTELKQVTRKLEESEAQFKLIADYTYNWEIFRDHTGKLIYSSPAFERITGYKNEDYLSGKIVLKDIVHPDDFENVWSVIQRVLAGEYIQSIEYRLIKPNNEIVYVETAANPVLASETEYIGFRTSTRDITERKRIEEKLKQSEKKFFKAFKKSPYAKSFTRLSDGIIVDVNDEYCKLSGYLFDEIIGKSAKDLGLWVDISDREKVVSLLLNGDEVNDYKIIFCTKLRAHKTISLSADIIRLQDEDYLISSFKDITEHNKTEAGLKARLELNEYSTTHSLHEVLVKTLDSICQLTESPIGFYHFVDEDQKNLTLQAWSTKTISNYCHTKVTEMHYPIEKAGVWAYCVQTRKPILHNDYESLPHKKGLPAGHAPLMRELVVPILRHDKVVALLGVGNKPGLYDDKDIEFVSFFADVAWEIAVRKNTEIALKESEEKFKMLFEQSPIGMALVDHATGDFLEVNSSILKATGYTKDEFLKLSYWDITPREYEEQEIKQLQDLNETGYFGPNQKEYIRKDGTRYPLSISGALFINSNDKKVVWGIIEDITERKKAEELLKAQELFLRTLTDNIPGLVAYWTKDLICGFANSNYIEWFGKTKDEMQGITMMELMGDALFNKNKPYIEKTLLGERVDFERTLVKANGETGYTWAHYIPDIKDGSVIGFYVLVSDITEIKLAEKKIQQQNKELHELNITKDKFMSIIAHDLRSPFTALLGFIDLVKQKLETNEIDEIKRYVGIVDEVAKNTFSLLENLLTWSRSQQGEIPFKPRNYSLNNIIEDCYAIVTNTALAKNISIKLNFEEALTAKVDVDMINTVLRNLMSNAIKFTPKGREIAIKTFQNSQFATVTVSDTGVGMNKETIDNLFKLDKSKSTNGTNGEQGSGLGLFLCKEFVEKHGGAIWVDSQVGKGTKFSFTIPKN